MADLFKDIKTINKFIAINNAFELESIAPYILSAADKYLKEWIGSPLYDQLVSQNQSDELSEVNKKLIPYVQKTLINFAVYEYTPMGQVQFSDSGIHIAVTENKKTAFEHQVKLLRQSMLEAGYDGIEAMMSFLETNEDDYPLWKDAPEYTKNRKHFINSGKDFNELYEIKRKSQTFRAITPVMGDMETFAIEPTIGLQYYNELKTLIKDKGEVSENDSIVIGYIKKALAYFTIAEAINQDMVSLTADGVMYNKDSSPLDSKRISTKIAQAQNFGNRYLDKLIKHLNGNLDNYPTYKSFIAEDDESTESNNKNLKSIFVI